MESNLLMFYLIKYHSGVFSYLIVKVSDDAGDRIVESNRNNKDVESITFHTEVEK